jgi:hypothetical protein
MTLRKLIEGVQPLDVQQLVHAAATAAGEAAAANGGANGFGDGDPAAAGDDARPHEWDPSAYEDLGQVLNRANLPLPDHISGIKIVRQMQRGGSIDFIPWEFIADAMEYLFPGRWDYDIKAYPPTLVAEVPAYTVQIPGVHRPIEEPGAKGFIYQYRVRGRVTVWNLAGQRVRRAAMGEGMSHETAGGALKLSDKGITSSETNAFKRACAKIGVGRYLYCRTEGKTNRQIMDIRLGDVLAARDKRTRTIAALAWSGARLFEQGEISEGTLHKRLTRLSRILRNPEGVQRDLGGDVDDYLESVVARDEERLGRSGE